MSTKVESMTNEQGARPPRRGPRRREPGSPVGDPVLDRLRRLYDDIVNEPLPDELLRLLEQLDEVERKR